MTKSITAKPRLTATALMVDDARPILKTDTVSEMATFDWHSGPVRRTAPVTACYRNTQNVRRFLIRECGDGFKFDRPFMAWIKNGTPKTMGDVADEWLRRRRSKQI